MQNQYIIKSHITTNTSSMNIKEKDIDTSILEIDLAVAGEQLLKLLQFYYDSKSWFLLQLLYLYNHYCYLL